MNHMNRRLLLKSAALLVTQAATLEALEETTGNPDPENLMAAFAYTAYFERLQPYLFEMEGLIQARAGDNELFRVLGEILEANLQVSTTPRKIFSGRSPLTMTDMEDVQKRLSDLEKLVKGGASHTSIGVVTSDLLRQLDALSIQVEAVSQTMGELHPEYTARYEAACKRIQNSKLLEDRADYQGW